jgi:hypothetical protein
MAENSAGTDEGGPEAGGPRLYNSKIVSNYIKLMRDKYPSVSVAALLAEVGIETYQVDDQGHWFTQDEIDRFHESIARVTGESNIAREAGRYNASPAGRSIVARYVFGLAGPAKVYETISKIAGSFTRSTRRPRSTRRSARSPAASRARPATSRRGSARTGSS